MPITPELEKRIEKLAEKYEASGQDLLAFLDGLLYANYITYWDYIHLDTLLSLQKPRTDFPDEEIFIMYHQITELYFKLSLHEIKQITAWKKPEADELLEKIERINRYFLALTTSFGVMEKGMKREDFLKFRMALIPASGFQSGQYRQIEIGATDLINLVDKDKRESLRKSSIEKQFAYIYWRNGATIQETGEKTLTLKQFESKYNRQFLEDAQNSVDKNLWQQYQRCECDEVMRKKLTDALRTLDLNVNVTWPLQHYKTAVAYLAKRSGDVAATGGTNWQQYLPPRFQRRIFYPELWSDKEKEEWGKFWVESVLKEMHND
ncbi:MAG: tryptophan 2,3-dioxygenase [Cryomorphaceae bacterium]|nr:tryptophan 2,3-dioxygenase [Cryomorphaceae bacterium]